MKHEDIITELHTIYNKLMVGNANSTQLEALEHATHIVEKAAKVEKNKRKIVWVDDAKPARKVGIWPRITIEATEPMVWVGYDEESGREVHKIVKGSVGYDVHKLRGQIADINYMTLEQAKKFCENY